MALTGKNEVNQPILRLYFSVNSKYFMLFIFDRRFFVVRTSFSVSVLQLIFDNK